MKYFAHYTEEILYLQNVPNIEIYKAKHRNNCDI